MTAEGNNVTRMAAGRELDALVAERVMGWRFYLVQRGDCTHVEVMKPARERLYHIDTTRPISVAEIDRHKHITDTLDGFRPSSNIADAWPVLEKMLRQRSDLFLGFSIQTKGAWGIGIVQAYGEASCLQLNFGVPCEADTAPLAICRAALLVCRP